MTMNLLFGFCLFVLLLRIIKEGNKKEKKNWKIKEREVKEGRREEGS